MADNGIFSLFIAVVGCFIGLAGWLSGRDKKISNDGEWRGSVNTKLDQIILSTTNSESCIKDLENRVTKIEEKVEQLYRDRKECEF